MKKVASNNKAKAKTLKNLNTNQGTVAKFTCMLSEKTVNQIESIHHRLTQYQSNAHYLTDYFIGMQLPKTMATTPDQPTFEDYQRFLGILSNLRIQVTKLLEEKQAIIKKEIHHERTN